MEEVTASLILLATLITKVASNHCITGDHISTYDNFLSLPFPPRPCPDVPISSFAYLPTEIQTGYGLNHDAPGSCDKCGKSCSNNNCDPSRNCAKYNSFGASGVSGNYGTAGSCGSGACGKCKKAKREKVRPLTVL